MATIDVHNMPLKYVYFFKKILFGAYNFQKFKPYNICFNSIIIDHKHGRRGHSPYVLAHY